MSARHRESERIVTPRLKMADWSGVITPDDGVSKARLCALSGSLICAATGWRLAITAVLDSGTVFLTARFDAPVSSDDAAPWTLEHDLARPHQLQAAGYDRCWTGAMTRTGNLLWAGELGDRYGGRLAVAGKAQGRGVISLRATAQEVRG